MYLPLAAGRWPLAGRISPVGLSTDGGRISSSVGSTPSPVNYRFNTIYLIAGLRVVVSDFFVNRFVYKPDVLCT